MLWTPWPCFKLRCAGGREFNPRTGQYSRMSFSSDQVTGTVSSSEHAFPSGHYYYISIIIIRIIRIIIIIIIYYISDKMARDEAL